MTEAELVAHTREGLFFAGDAVHVSIAAEHARMLCDTIDRLTADLAAVTAEKDEARAHDVRTMKPNDIALALPGGEHDRLVRLIEGLALQAATAERERDEAKARAEKLEEALKHLEFYVRPSAFGRTMVAQAAREVLGVEYD